MTVIPVRAISVVGCRDAHRQNENRENEPHRKTVAQDSIYHTTRKMKPKLSVSHFGFKKNYYKNYGLCYFAISKWKTHWDCRSYRIYGVRYLPA
jgi:hypothetical protein